MGIIEDSSNEELDMVVLVVAFERPAAEEKRIERTQGGTLSRANSDFCIVMLLQPLSKAASEDNDDDNETCDGENNEERRTVGLLLVNTFTNPTEDETKVMFGSLV